MRLLLAEDRAVLSDALLSQLGRAGPSRAGFVVQHAPRAAVAGYLPLRVDFDRAVLDMSADGRWPDGAQAGARRQTGAARLTAFTAGLPPVLRRGSSAAQP